MVVSLMTSVAGNDDYQRACTRRETPIEGTDSFGSLPVDHKGIVKVVEYAQQDDALQYYVMEYVEDAKSLRQRMNQNTNPFFRDPLKAVDGFIQIVEALAECVKLGIIHRDLSPANVLVTDDAQIQ